MAFTALEKMQKRNKHLFKIATPKQPKKHYREDKNDLKSLALRFLDQRCQNLCFDSAKEALEIKENKYYGTSLLPNQIPYNMQMDINRLCLMGELEKFIDSGVSEDAYTVYYCYLEMFFGHYGKSKKMVELLSEYEYNGSSLLMKHRDHYSHSVYVFALGLAIYEANGIYRKTFKNYYGFDTDENNLEADRKAAHTFLQYWGLTALFHDIGYPFELPFEQVLSYFEVTGKKRGEGSLYIAYHDVDSMINFSVDAKEHFKELYGETFDNIEQLIAYDISLKLAKNYKLNQDYIYHKIHAKPTRPNEFGYFMDHAYFSCVRLYHEMEKSLKIEKINKKHIDALSAIMLHNSLFKFAINFYKDDENRKNPLDMKTHPLAYLLMLTDELQCWDRTAYGRNSRSELHPTSSEFDFSSNSIRATYYYDQQEQEKISDFELEYHNWEKAGEIGKAPRLKAYSDMAEKEQRFTADIKKIVDLSEISLTVMAKTRPVDRKSKKTYLSNSNFLHLYDFAVALNARYFYQGKEKYIEEEVMEKEFEKLSLEYQLSNINQAKSFAKYLDALGCFYTDRLVDYEMVTAFTKEQIEKFAPMEHERWIKEHISMGWTSGNLYENVKLPNELLDKFASKEQARQALREQLRMHKLVMDGNPNKEDMVRHYQLLSEEDKLKDFEPFNSMLKLIKKFDGLRIYKLD